jgi:hypothetical protein
MTQIAMTACSERSEVKQPAEESPFLAEFFMIEGPGYRCMAYNDSEGRWRKAFNHTILPGQIRIIE